MPPESSKFKKDYNEFIQQLELCNVFQDKLKAELDRNAFRKVMSSEELAPIDYSVAEDYAWRNYNDNLFEFKTIFTINAKNPLDKRQTLFEFETGLVALYRSNREINDELAKYFVTNVKLNVWPYLREQVHDISKRFNMPDLVIPPFKVGCE